MKKALIALTALAAAVTGIEPAMATSGTTTVAVAVDKGDAASVTKQRHGRWDRGRHYGHGNRWNRGRRVCRTEWRHHRRVRVCRVVRWR